MRARLRHAGVMVALLAGCASVPPRASMADRDPLRREIVADVVDGLSELYEPDATSLVPVRAMTGSFDVALMAALRAKGFVVQAVAGRGKAFDCHVDVLDGAMYRVTTRIGSARLSRVWVLDGASAYTGGAWTRQE